MQSWNIAVYKDNDNTPEMFEGITSVEAHGEKGICIRFHDPRKKFEYRKNINDVMLYGQTKRDRYTHK